MSSEGNKPSRLENTSHILYDSGSSSYTTYSNTVRIPIVGPDIELEKKTDAREAVPGKPIPYRVILRNKGNYAAKVVLYDELPKGMAFVPGSIVKDGVPLPGVDLDEGLKLGTVDPGEKVKVAFQLVLKLGSEEDCGKKVCNRMKASVSFYSSNGRKVKENVFSNTICLPVAKADEAVPFAKLTVDPAKAAPGDRLSYKLIVGNQGHAAAMVTLLSFLPKGLLYVPNSLTINGNWMSGGVPGNAGIPLGLIEPGESVTVAWEVVVPGVTIVSPGQWIDNRAILKASCRDPSCAERVSEEFHSNKTVVELCFPVITAKLKAKPEVSFPDGYVNFTLQLANAGNRAAICGSDKLLRGPISLVPESLTVDGEGKQATVSDNRIVFGELAPSGVMRILFQGIISPLVTTRTLRGHIDVQYEYLLHDQVHKEAVSTNPYTIAIMHDDE
jgi:uncharacterized repeat protein (TIGR01451 family)